MFQIIAMQRLKGDYGLSPYYNKNDFKKVIFLNSPPQTTKNNEQTLTGNMGKKEKELIKTGTAHVDYGQAIKRS